MYFVSKFVTFGIFTNKHTQNINLALRIISVKVHATEYLKPAFRTCEFRISESSGLALKSLR